MNFTISNSCKLRADYLWEDHTEKKKVMRRLYAFNNFHESQQVWYYFIFIHNYHIDYEIHFLSFIFSIRIRWNRSIKDVYSFI